ncbi:MAG: potassium channel protein [Planctomycetota bacterium]|nr:potassium channel protein [Planctomycetota bacterium]
MEIRRSRFLPAPRETPRLRLVRAGALLAVVVITGTAGIMLVEGWDPVQSLFFTLITLTTVGYGDYGLSEAGKLFAVGLMVVGLGVVTYSAGQLLPSLFNRQLVWERTMNNRILKLKGHFIVCGLGRIGRSVCQHLARDGVPFIGIDPDPDSVAILVDAGHLALVGDATDDDVLAEAGIERAKAIACVTGSDSENIVITLSARERNRDLLIVSRAEQEDTIRKMQRAGATRVISPVRSGGVSIVNAILKPNLADFLDRTHDRGEDFELAEITIEEGSTLDGLTIRDKGTAHEKVLVIGLKRAEGPTRLRPSLDERLRGGDVLIIAGDVMSINAVQREAAAGPLAA